MTIAVGFICVDGVVLASDSEYSGSLTKTQGQKIFPIHHGKQFSVTVAGAGHVGLIKRTVQMLSEALEPKKDQALSLRDIQGVLEDALCAIHKKHLYDAPPNQHAILDYWLVVAAWTAKEGHAMFRTDITAVNRLPHGDNCCVGIGEYLGNYLLDLLSRPGMNVEDAKPVAAYIVRQAKDYVVGCGQATFMRVLKEDGSDERIIQGEIEAGEKKQSLRLKAAHVRGMRSSSQ